MYDPSWYWTEFDNWSIYIQEWETNLEDWEDEALDNYVFPFERTRSGLLCYTRFEDLSEDERVEWIRNKIRYQ